MKIRKQGLFTKDLEFSLELVGYKYLFRIWFIHSGFIMTKIIGQISRIFTKLSVQMKLFNK